MGSLILPKSGAVYLDANGFIYSIERIDPYSSILAPMWLAAHDSRFVILSSELVLLETLIKPFRERDEVLENLFRELFGSYEVQLIPTTAVIWEMAAQLRASTGLKTPDALHAASALAAGCDLFVTNDPHFRRVANLPVVILSDLVESDASTT